MRTMKDMGLRLCQFRGSTRSNAGLFECYCTPSEAMAAINFIRFLD